jgi:16S rRNA (adenine1518-N6/adenine1519-N6)-dimethyltransferase
LSHQQNPHAPKKRFGQNFLRSEPAAEKIVAAIEAREGETVVEIGPGEGALTRLLENLPNRVVAIELDRDLVPRLRGRFGGRIEVVEGDALTTPFPPEPFRAVGNLPYNVATPIVRRAAADPNFVRGVFMLQKEVADRILASPGDREYGFLTLAIGMYADARRLMTLEPGSFFPRPKVRSSVVVLDRVERPLRSPREGLLEVVSAAFRMPRKTILNNLAELRGGGKEKAAEILAAAGIDAAARPGTLSLEDYDTIALIAARSGGVTEAQP